MIIIMIIIIINLIIIVVIIIVIIMIIIVMIIIMIIMIMSCKPGSTIRSEEGIRRKVREAHNWFIGLQVRLAHKSEIELACFLPFQFNK